MFGVCGDSSGYYSLCFWCLSYPDDSSGCYALRFLCISYPSIQHLSHMNLCYIDPSSHRLRTWYRPTSCDLLTFGNTSHNIYYILGCHPPSSNELSSQSTQQLSSDSSLQLFSSWYPYVQCHWSIYWYRSNTSNTHMDRDCLASIQFGYFPVYPSSSLCFKSYSMAYLRRDMPRSIWK